MYVSTSFFLKILTKKLNLHNYSGISQKPGDKLGKEFVAIVKCSSKTANQSGQSGLPTYRLCFHS